MPLASYLQCRRYRSLYNLAIFLVTSLFVQLGLTHVYGNRNVKEMSDAYFTLITPPGGAFAIFGIIYISELCSLLVQLRTSWTSCRCHEEGSPPVIVSETAHLIQPDSTTRQILQSHRKSCASTYPCGMHTIASMTGWSIACIFQAVWMIAFLQECMIAALISLFLVFLSLLTVIASCTATFYRHEKEGGGDGDHCSQQQYKRAQALPTSNDDSEGAAQDESINKLGECASSKKLEGETTISHAVGSTSSAIPLCLSAHSTSRMVSALQWLLRVAPFSLHCGWMTAAFAVALQNLEVQYCASSTVQLSSVVLSVVFASLVVYEVSIRNVNPAYAAGLSWALLFLTQREVGTPICVGDGGIMAPASPEVHQTITYVALLGGLGFLALSIVRCVWPLLTTCLTDLIRPKAPELRERKETTVTAPFEQSILQWLLTRQ